MVAWVSTEPSVEDVGWLQLDEATGVGAVRRRTEQLADRLGMPGSRVAEVGLAVTEIATNIHAHAGSGAVLLRLVRAGDAGAVEIVAVDAGPGIQNVHAARQDGYSTAGTLGIGLGAANRLANTLDISSVRGRGTVVVARFAANRSGAAAMDTRSADTAGITRALSGEAVCGDGYATRRDGDRTSLMVCDGSGHGPLAASATQQAIRTFNDPNQPMSPPETAVRRIHQALVGTRGAAVAVAELDAKAQLVRFVSVGNITGAILSSLSKRSMISIGGVAGYRQPTIRAFEYPLPPESVVILHSDGVSSRWGGEVLQGLLSQSPLVIAATLLRDAGIHHDDACVLVGRRAR